MKKEKVLVAGAHGTTGQQVIDLLVESDQYKPIAMVRKTEQHEYFEGKGVSTVQGDLEEDISHTVKEVDKVIFAAGSKGKNLEAVDKKGAIKLIDASKEQNISKFVMLSSVGADDPSQSDELREYLQAKHDADEYLKESDLNYTIVRPGSLTDEASTGEIELKSKLSEQGKIPRADVAKVLVEVLMDNLRDQEHFEIISGSTHIREALVQPHS